MDDDVMRPGLFLNVAPAVGLTLAVLVAGLLPSVPRVPLGIEWGDKIEHAIGFAVVSFCYMRAARRIWPAASPSITHARAAWAAVALGASLELLQALVPFRTAEFLDLVADSFGVLVTWGALRLIDSSVAESHG
jgi:VanZ family protein